MADSFHTTNPSELGEFRCEITGKRVREADLVTLHGQRMSVEGKQHLLERLPKQIGVVDVANLEAAPLGLRGAAALIDIGIFVVVAFVVLLFALASLMPELATMDPQHPPQIPLATMLRLQVIFNATAVIYLVFFEAVLGRTPGKMWAKIKVIRIDGQPMSVLTVAIRSLTLLVPIFLNLLAAIIGEKHILIAGTISLIWLIYPIVDLCMTLLDTHEHRSLHDQVAETRVVRGDGKK